MRQIILDTETTGLRAEDGHRIIEIGCLEMIDRRLTGRKFHHYLNPEREIDAGAVAVHGITNDFLKDKPFFHAIANEFMDFVSGTEVIIHNAPFDLSFLNEELTRTKQGWKSLTDYCQVLDTLPLARQRHVGQRNSLDALCKRYAVDNSKREFHGALLDAYLLSQVYLAMTGGQGSLFDSEQNDTKSTAKHTTMTAHSVEKHSLRVIPASNDELSDHANYLELLKKQGKCVWTQEE